MVQTSTLVLWQIPLLNQTLVYIKKLVLSKICPCFKTVCYLTALTFLHIYPLRITIAMWHITSLLVLKPISAWSVLIQSSFSSSHVCGDFCIGLSRWIVSSVLPTYLGNCTVGCPCGQPWVFWLACCFLEFQVIFA